MKKVTLFLLVVSTLLISRDGFPDESSKEVEVTNKTQKKVQIEKKVTTTKVKKPNFLAKNSSIRVSAKGIGVAPPFAHSPAQAYALAKRAALADAYRILGERLKGVYVEGQDVVENMVVKSSQVQLYVSERVRNAEILDTTFKDGMCEVEVEVELNYSDF